MPISSLVLELKLDYGLYNFTGLENHLMVQLSVQSNNNIISKKIQVKLDSITHLSDSPVYSKL